MPLVELVESLLKLVCYQRVLRMIFSITPSNINYRLVFATLSIHVGGVVLIEPM